MCQGLAGRPHPLMPYEGHRFGELGGIMQRVAGNINDDRGPIKSCAGYTARRRSRAGAMDAFRTCRCICFVMSENSLSKFTAWPPSHLWGAGVSGLRPGFARCFRGNSRLPGASNDCRFWLRYGAINYALLARPFLLERPFSFQSC